MDFLLESTESFQEYIQRFLLTHATSFVLAIVALVVGLWSVKVINSVSAKTIERSVKDEALGRFAKSVLNILLKIVVIVVVASILGIETASFAAIIVVVGVIIGLALQGNLSNLACGVLITIFKPFKVGDMISSGVFTGTVNEVQVFHTFISTPDNKVIILPNSMLSTAPVINHTREQRRRIDFSFNFHEHHGLHRIKELLILLVRKHPKVLKEPAPAVLISEISASGIRFSVMSWVKTEHYQDVSAELLESIKESLQLENIPLI